MIITPASVTISQPADDAERRAHADALLIWAEVDRAHGEIDYWRDRTAHVKKLHRLAAPTPYLDDKDHAGVMVCELYREEAPAELAAILSDIDRTRAAIKLLHRAVTRGELLEGMCEELERAAASYQAARDGGEQA